MTSHVFQCPTCGAPLLPKRGAAVLRCPYCRTSVAVPEALRPSAGIDAWSTLLFDGFTANDHDWLVGDQSGEYFAPLTRTIADGRYRWEATVQRASSIAPAWLLGYPVSDFHLQVNGKHLRGSRAGSSCGVVFRVQDRQNGYCFRIADTQFFALSIAQEGHWTQIVDWTRTNMIKPHGVNQLEVIAQGPHFSLLVNGQIVSEVEDDRLPQGLVGLAIEGYTLGEAIAYDFLDMTLRAP